MFCRSCERFNGKMTEIQQLMYHLLPKAHLPSSQGDGPNGACSFCSAAHLSPGEPEKRAGHHQLSGGEAATDSGGLCETNSYWTRELCITVFFSVDDFVCLVVFTRKRKEKIQRL